MQLTIFLGLIAFSTAGGTFEFYGDDSTCTTPASDAGSDCETALAISVNGLSGSEPVLCVCGTSNSLESTVTSLK